MFAVSRDNRQIHVFEPRSGLRIPVILDVPTGNVRIAAPSAEELHEDFVVLHDEEELRSVAPAKHAKVAVDFSRIYSHILAEPLNNGRVTVAALRQMVTRHFRKQTPKELGEAYRELRKTGEVSAPLAALRATAVS